MNVSIVHPLPRLGTRKTALPSGAFTLVEVLVSLVVLTILLLVSAEVIGQVQNTWTQSNARVTQFREARTAFDIITRNLSQATLNTYVDYDNNYLKSGATTAVNAAAVAPSKYVRKSDLQFRCGPATTLITNGGQSNLTGDAVFFQAPLGVSHQAGMVGLDRLLCGRGYFVQFSSDEFFKPEFITQVAPRFRYRLMEFSPPAEKNLIYASGKPDGSGNIDAWYADAGIPLKVQDRDKESNPENVAMNRPIADNILTLIISPQTETADGTARTAIAPDYKYDSVQVGKAIPGSSQGTQHMLPPLVRVVLVAVDERSYDRLTAGDDSGTPPDGLPAALNAFTNAGQLDQEIEELEKVLRQKKLNYRVFSATIQLRGSKWST